MQNTGCEEALAGRVEDMLDPCTRCGACFSACPIAAPAGLGDADAQTTVSGVLDILRLGKGPAEAERWARACMLSGECIKACDYGVNPRFLLVMARLALARQNEPRERRKTGVDNFRRMSQDVGILSQLQLSDAALERLGQKPQTAADRDELPDVVFYTGCNVLKTPHIALLCLDIMDALGTSYKVMGGPSHCCGVIQLRTGDTATASRFSGTTIGKLAQSRSGEVLSWCPSCFVQFTENMLPTFERATGERPFEMTPFMRFLQRNLAVLRPLLKERVALTIALHKHPGVAGVMDAAEEILRAIPGIAIVTL